MDTFMSFMDKIYSDTKALTIVYVVGAALLLLFIIMLIFSLRKPKTKKMNTKILDEPNIKDEKKEEKIEESTKEEVKEEVKEVNDNLEESKVIEEAIVEPVQSPEENSVMKALDNVETKEIVNEVKEELKPTVSTEIPDVDEFVDNVVKKTYEKNEQFSSVFVGDNTTTIKLDKVLEDLNVDEDIKVDIVPEEEKTEASEPVEEIKEDSNETVITENVTTAASLVEDKKEEQVTSLDALKKAMDEKKKEVNSKQDELKAKLEGLKQAEKKEDVLKAEDLLNKLKDVKE